MDDITITKKALKEANCNFGCNSFIQKPVEFDRFVQLIKEVGLYGAY